MRVGLSWGRLLSEPPTPLHFDHLQRDHLPPSRLPPPVPMLTDASTVSAPWQLKLRTTSTSRPPCSRPACRCSWTLACSTVARAGSYQREPMRSSLPTCTRPLCGPVLTLRPYR